MNPHPDLASLIEDDFSHLAESMRRGGLRRFLQKIVPQLATIAANRSERYFEVYFDTRIESITQMAKVIQSRVSELNETAKMVPPLAEALKRYSTHDKRCDLTMLNIRYDSMVIPDEVRETTRCSCGLDEILEIIDES
jgi:hypothetical protein